MDSSNEDVRHFQVNHLTGHLSERMRRLCRDVLLRLPEGWDEYRSFHIEESQDVPTQPGGKIGYANALRYEEAESLPSEMPDGVDIEQCWTVKLFVKHLALLSDVAVCWGIAHELAHIASGLNTGSMTIGNVPMTQVSPGHYEPAPPTDLLEEAANLTAESWGFSEERQRFLSETKGGPA